MRALKSLLKLCITYGVYFVVGLVPRDKKIWAIGSFGVFNDNSRHFYLHLVNNPTDNIRPIWLSKNRDSVDLAREHGEAYHLYSIRGMYFAVRAKVYVFSCYVTDIAFAPSRGSFKVNLWHGTPIKKIEFDIKSPPLSKYFDNPCIWIKIQQPRLYINYDLFISPSKYATDLIFKSAFKNHSEIFEAEFPRVSYLKEKLKNHEYQAYDFVFLYTPTWRELANDFLQESGIDFVDLNNFLKARNAVFLLKLHPNTQIEFDLSVYSHIRRLNNQYDVAEALKVSDCLITDYSSIYFDYLVLDRPIVFFNFDYDEYIVGRDFYIDYEKDVPGDKVSDYRQLKLVMADILNGGDSYKTSRAIIASQFLTEDNKTAEIVEKIISKL